MRRAQTDTIRAYTWQSMYLSDESKEAETLRLTKEQSRLFLLIEELCIGDTVTVGEWEIIRNSHRSYEVNGKPFYKGGANSKLKAVILDMTNYILSSKSEAA